MAKATSKTKRLNPFHPKVNLYGYAVKPKFARKIKTVASGRSFALSADQLKNKLRAFYGTGYTITVKKVDKRSTLENYGGNKHNYTDLYLGSSQQF